MSYEGIIFTKISPPYISAFLPFREASLSNLIEVKIYEFSHVLKFPNALPVYLILLSKQGNGFRKSL